MTTWQEVRTQWVNGNRSDAKNVFYQQNKTRIFRVILEALRSHYDSMPSGTVRSGDLQDLIEILNSIANAKGEN